MKKTIICGIASLAMAAAPVFSAFAEPPQAGSSTSGNMIGTHDVTVGEVDETVYSVDISWGDMTFDWKYDSEKNEYGFKARLGCSGYLMSADDTYLTAAKEENILFSDDSCSVLQTSELINDTTYYMKDNVGGSIKIEDLSVNGKVKANASFLAEEGYEWVVGKFSNTYTLTPQTGDIEYGEDLNNGLLEKLPNSSGIYYGWLYFEKANSQMPSGAISTSDKIGTVTVTISPDYESYE